MKKFLLAGFVAGVLIFSYTQAAGTFEQNFASLSLQEDQPEDLGRELLVACSEACDFTQKEECHAVCAMCAILETDKVSSETSTLRRYLTWYTPRKSQERVSQVAENFYSKYEKLLQPFTKKQFVRVVSFLAMTDEQIADLAFYSATTLRRVVADLDPMEARRVASRILSAVIVVEAKGDEDGDDRLSSESNRLQSYLLNPSFGRMTERYVGSGDGPDDEYTDEDFVQMDDLEQVATDFFCKYANLFRGFPGDAFVEVVRELATANPNAEDLSRLAKVDLTIYEMVRGLVRPA